MNLKRKEFGEIRLSFCTNKSYDSNKYVLWKVVERIVL